MKRHYYIAFAILVFLLLLTLALILFTEMQPDWKKYQKAYFQKERSEAAKVLGKASSAERARLKKRLTYLEHPQYRIRQILLDGGNRVDRCITCHLDTEELQKKHPEIERFPFEKHGCTTCHGGVGRATEITMAHSTLRIPPRPLHEYLEAHAEGSSDIDLFHFTASGKPIPFTGSKRCLQCHLSSHPNHVARWRKIKFQPLEKVKNKLREIRKKGLFLDESRCLMCHTTGFGERTGKYVEDRVTCESCHGPGGFYSDLMSGGRARDGAELARANILKTDAERICLHCHKPDRHVDYEGIDASPALVVTYLGKKPPPEMDGILEEAVWKTTPETRLPTWQLDKPSPIPGAEVTMRSLYDGGRIYFSLQWPDGSPQTSMGKWFSTGKERKAKVEWPDALALHWQATAEVADFKQGGCAVLCHNSGRFKKFPRMATREAKALVDEWYWNAFLSPRAGRPGDGFLDNRTEFIPEGKPKPFTGGTYPELSIAHGSDTSGARMPGTLGGIPVLLNPGAVKEREPVPFGEKTLPLYVTGAPEQGDSAHLTGRASCSNGTWTLELSRALRTGSRRDVQLDPAVKETTFGLAVWNGASGEKHQVATKIRLLFEPSPRD